jgi:hypothetical protein
MADVLCEKCKKVMRKKGSLNMSNSKFDVYICSSCGSERKICVGLL